jgi:hypothetical protein
MLGLKSQPHIRMEKTRPPTTHSRKGQAHTPMGKTSQLTMHSRKEQAQLGDAVSEWARAHPRAQVPPEHQQDQEGIKYGLPP